MLACFSLFENKHTSKKPRHAWNHRLWTGSTDVTFSTEHFSTLFRKISLNQLTLCSWKADYDALKLWKVWSGLAACLSCSSNQAHSWWSRIFQLAWLKVVNCFWWQQPCPTKPFETLEPQNPPVQASELHKSHLSTKALKLWNVWSGSWNCS